MSSDLDDRLLDPVAVDRHLRGADLAMIASVFERARGRGQRAWMTMAVCVGRAQAQGGRGDAVIERMAELFRLHRSRIARLGRIYREALLPRLEGTSAPTFPLAEQAWYEIATEAAGPLGRPALALLAEAEERKGADPRYSTRRWKSDLGITNADSESAKLRALLVRLTDVEDDAVEEFAQGDADQNRELLVAASRIIGRASRPTRASTVRSLCRTKVEGGDTTIEEITPDLAAQLGYTPAELIGSSFFQFVWNAERARRAFELLSRGERPDWVPRSFEPGHFEFRHATGAKAILPLDYVVRTRSDGTFDGLDLQPTDPSDPARKAARLPLVGAHDQWLLDVRGRTVSVAEAIALALGETPASMLGASYWEFQLDVQASANSWTELVRDPIGSNGAAQLAAGARRLRRRVDDSAVDLGLEMTLLVGPAGEWKGVLLTPPLDLLQERLAQETPRPEPVRSGSLDHALAIWVIDSELRTVFASPEIATLLGTTADKVVGRSALDFSPEPAQWRTVFALLGRGISPPWTPGWRPGAISARAADGRTVELPLHLTRHHSPLGEFLGVSLYASAMAVPEESLAPTARPARESMWIVRANDLETLFIAPELADILGSTREDMVGRSALPYLTVAGDTVRATGDLRGSELLWVGHAGPRRFVRTDGTNVTLHVESHPVYDARGQLTHVAAVFGADGPTT